jgi:hypothetical protein
LCQEQDKVIVAQYKINAIENSKAFKNPGESRFEREKQGNFLDDTCPFRYSRRKDIGSDATSTMGG